MVNDACALPGALRQLVAVALGLGKQRRVYIIFFNIADAQIAACLDVFTKRPHKPQQIIGAAAANTLVALGMGMPPVHYVALDILMTACVKNTLAGVDGAYQHEIYAVLKLIAKADSAAALIQAASSLKPAGYGLIRAPAAEIAVKRRARSAYGKAIKQRAPVRLDGG